VGVSRCDCSTIATLSRSHGLHPSGPSFPLFRDPLYLPDSPLSLSLSFSRSACLSHPLLPLSSHSLGSVLAIIPPPPIRLATPGAAKCLFETHPSRRHFPADGIDTPVFRRESTESPTASTALTALTCSFNANRRSPASRKFEKLAHDRPIGPRILLSSRNRGRAHSVARPYASHACEFLTRRNAGEPRNITCCWHDNSPNAKYANHGRCRGEEKMKANRDYGCICTAIATASSHFYFLSPLIFDTVFYATPFTVKIFFSIYNSGYFLFFCNSGYSKKLTTQVQSETFFILSVFLSNKLLFEYSLVKRES